MAVVATGAAVTTSGLIVLLVGARLLVRLPTQTLVGSLAGVTHPAVLAYTTDQLEDERQLTLGYATVFPLAMIAKILLAQLLVTGLL